jgi:inorganic pyrophosphatase
MWGIVFHVDFWQGLDALVGGHGIVIDRPAGSVHPRFPEFAYPLDYGYLDGTRSPDGGGIDAWVGSLPGRRVTGVVCTVDLLKQEVELKLLVSCNPTESEIALAANNRGGQAAALVLRPDEPAPQAGPAIG